jgi:catechol 2,3-dioxygenase-like lactoylglutathione lyase family enzyme
MLGYVTIGARDSEASGKFYDAVLDPLGDERKFADGGWIGYGPKGSEAHYCYVCPPFNGEAATGGNGSMLAFKAPSQEAVDAAYAAGLAHGGSDEGKPGFRPPEGTEFYGAYLRDPTGNKLCVYFKK